MKTRDNQESSQLKHFVALHEVDRLFFTLYKRVTKCPIRSHSLISGRSCNNRELRSFDVDEKIN